MNIIIYNKYIKYIIYINHQHHQSCHEYQVNEASWKPEAHILKHYRTANIVWHFTRSIVPSYVLQHTLNAPASCVRRFISDFLPPKETVAHPHDNLSRKRQKLVSASSYSSGNFENMKSYDKTPSFGLPMVTLYHTAMQPSCPKQHRPNFQQVKAKGNKNTKNQGRLVKKLI